MIKITDDIVVLEFRREELDRVKRPDDLPEGASMWPLIIPEEYKDWHIRWTLQDLQSERWIAVLTRKPVHILQEVVFDEDTEQYNVVERIWDR